MIENPIVMCSLIWAITVFLLGCLFYRYMSTKAQLKLQAADNERKHEKEMKELSDKMEAFWFDKKNCQKELKASTDEGLKNQVKNLKTKVSELEGKLATEEFNKELLKKELKMFSDILEQLKVEAKPKV